MSAQDVVLTAHDDASITADALAVSIAGSAAGTVGVSMSIGIAIAYNEVSNEVEAFIKDMASLSASGDVVVDARVLPGDPASATYDSTSFTPVTLQDGDTVRLEAGYAEPDYDTAPVDFSGTKYVTLNKGDFVLVADDYKHPRGFEHH